MHILHHKMCLGEEWERDNTLKNKYIVLYISGRSYCISHYRIVCVTRSIRGKQTTPLNSLCLNISFTNASFASAGCNCIACYGSIR